jgi:hypothetical protein
MIMANRRDSDRNEVPAACSDMVNGIGDLKLQMS